MSRKWAYLLIAVVIFIWAAWAVYILRVGGLDFTNGAASPYQITGQFGDSFGFLASLMSTLALVGALYSIHVQYQNYYRQQFESNFYRLLESVAQARDGARVALLGSEPMNERVHRRAKYHRLKRIVLRDEYEYVGEQSFAVIVYRLRERIGPTGYADVKSVGREFRKIGTPSRTRNYFRILYHLYVMLDKSKVSNKKFYSRIIRAHIGQNEMILLAYNCIVGEGRHKFRELLKKYSVLHNLNVENLDEYEKAELDFFQRKLDKDCFRFDKVKEVSY